ncbi:MAG: helix-turn-helix domain-containing protein, partial [Deltaproteobacteria bacterium]|nr:helix-turn-helix domain-containing protein [Deltaproteobacteria bacterium]
EDAKYQRAVEMLSGGDSQHDVAAELGVHKSTISRWRRRAMAEGKLHGCTPRVCNSATFADRSSVEA